MFLCLWAGSTSRIVCIQRTNCRPSSNCSSPFRTNSADRMANTAHHPHEASSDPKNGLATRSQQGPVHRKHPSQADAGSWPAQSSQCLPADLRRRWLRAAGLARGVVGSRGSWLSAPSNFGAGGRWLATPRAPRGLPPAALSKGGIPRAGSSSGR